VTKGLLDSGVPEEKTKEIEKQSEERFNALMQACGLNQ
jgi:hypothetical protein